MLSFFSSLFSRTKKANQENNYQRGFEEYQKGCTLVDNKQDEEALLFFDIAINNGITEAFQERADSLKSLGFFIDAIKDYTKAIEINPTDCNLYFCRGVARNAIGDLATAISDMPGF